MDGGFVVNKDDWECMSPEQKGWMTFNAIQNIDLRLSKLEKRPLVDKIWSALGGMVGGAAAYLGLKAGN